MAVSYEYYRIFYYVGKYGSFTRAAQILMNNQPNITRAMNNLEAELGSKLFFRSRKGVSLTPEGEKLFVRVQTAHEQLQIGEAEIMNAKNLKHGYLSIAVSEIALHEFILPVLQKYRTEYPGIHIKVMNNLTAQAINALEKGLVELAIAATPTEAMKPLHESPVKSFQDILIGGRSFFKLSENEISLKNLMEYPLISLGRGTRTYEFYDKFFSANGLLLEPSVEAATTDQILPMVKYDIGLGFIPYDFAKESLLNGEVVQIKLLEKIPSRKICLVRDKSRPLSTAALMFEKMIMKFCDTLADK